MPSNLRSPLLVGFGLRATMFLATAIATAQPLAAAIPQLNPLAAAEAREALTGSGLYQPQPAPPFSRAAPSDASPPPRPPSSISTTARR